MYAYSYRTSRSSRTPYRAERATARSLVFAVCVGLALCAALLYAGASDAQRGQLDLIESTAAPVVVEMEMEIDEQSPRTCCDPLSRVE